MKLALKHSGRIILAMNKAELLEKLESMRVLEEETVNSLARYCLALQWQKTVKPQYIDKITEGLVTLRDDTKRHMDTLARLKDNVKKEAKNGF